VFPRSHAFFLAALLSAGTPSVAGGLAAKLVLLTGELPAGSATQSSRYQPRGTQASDFGNADQALSGTNRPFAFHTQAEQGAWWAVDLGAQQLLDHARIVNRTDCCQERAATLEVYLSNEPFTNDVQSWAKAKKVYPLIPGRQVGAFNTLDPVSLADPAILGPIAKASQEMAEAGDNPEAQGIAEANALKAMMAAAASTYRYVGLRLAGKNNLHLKKVEIYGWRMPGT